MLLVLNSNALAHDDDSLTEAEHLVTEQTPCTDLSEEQLEMIGDYYMEQMHPGETHEQMDAMMGGEGSETLKEMHINMAKRFYCGDTTVTGCPMMSGGMMGGQSGSGMMSGGMMSGGMMGGQSGSGMMGDYSMTRTGTSGGRGFLFWNVLSTLIVLLLAALLILVIIASVKMAKK